MVVKHTFLEVKDPNGGDKGAGRNRAFTDTEILASTPVLGPADSSGNRLSVPEVSPLCRPEPSPLRRPIWPETPMLESIYEPEGGIDAAQASLDMNWMLPSTGADAASIEEQMMLYNQQWMMMQCGADFDYTNSMPNQCWGAEWPCSESTTSGPSDSSEGNDGQEWRTTVMLRNLPTEMTREMLLKMLDERGFYGLYDLVYLPVDFSTGSGLGYAFVNSCLPAGVKRLWNTFDGLDKWPVECDRVCTVSWSDPHQGLASHIERYQNSPVMHPDVPDEWKPALFMYGMRVEFPLPTKKIKAPKVRSKKASTETKAEKTEATSATAEATTAVATTAAEGAAAAATA